MGNTLGTPGSAKFKERLACRDPNDPILRLADCNIDDDSIRALVFAFKDNCTVTGIVLSINQIHDTGAQMLAVMLKDNRTLRELSLSFNQIGDAGVKELAEMLKGNRSLAYLALNTNKIGDAGAEALAHMLKDNRTLMELHLNDNQISDAGAQALAGGLKVNRTLMTLKLGSDQIRDAGAQAMADMLKDNRTLTELYLVGDYQIGEVLKRQISTLLHRNKTLRDQLQQAVQAGNLSEVKLLVSQGVGLLSTTSEGIRNRENQDNTLLHWAIVHGQSEVAEYLIQHMRENSLPLTVPNAKGKTAEQLATGSPLANLFRIESTPSITASSTSGQIKILMPSAAAMDTLSASAISPQQKPHQPKAEITKNNLIEVVKRNEINLETPISKVTIQQPPIQVSLIIDPTRLKTQRIIGEGAYGKVYFGFWNEHTSVAIKELKGSGLTEVMKEEFRNEAEVMANLRTPRIVQLYGVCFEGSLRLVMEYLPKGSLYDVLHSQENLEWPQRIRIALDTGEGLHFLHVQNPVILHRDLKSLNVLLDINYRAKLTDFGLARVKQVTQSTTTQAMSGKTKIIGTIAWMAPELFARKPEYSTASDVYAYGMVLWEMASRKIPFEEAADVSLIPMWVRDGDREEIPVETPQKYSQLIQRCWDGRREQRPIVNEIISELKTMESNTLASNSSNSNNSSNSSATSSTSSGPHYDSATASTSDGPRYDVGVISQLRK